MKNRILQAAGCLFVLGLFGCVLVAPVSAATYSAGFVWDWEADFSTVDNAPSDAGSVAKTENAGKNSGGATEDVWGYMDITYEVGGGFPGGTGEPTSLLTAYAEYFGPYGHAWNGGNGPAIGIDDGSEPCFGGADRGRHFIIGAMGPVGRPSGALRWVAPQTGYYNVNATFRSAALCPNDGVGTQVVRNTTALTELTMVAYGGSSSFDSSNMSLTAGDRLYFCVNAGPAGGWECDEVILDLTIQAQEAPTATPTDSPAPPTNTPTPVATNTPCSGVAPQLWNALDK